MSGCDDEGANDAGAAGTAGAGAGGVPSAGSGGAPSGGAGQGGGGTGGSGVAGVAGQSGGGSGGTPSAGGSGASEPDAGSPDAGSPDAGGPDAGGDAGSLTCDDTADTVVTCTDLGQADCVGQEGFLSSECEMVAFIMKPAPANAARNCMLALDPPDLCDPSNTWDCLVGALAASCPDPEADDECTTIGTTCGDSSPEFDACSSALSGMTQEGRDQMVQCMTTLVCNLYSCVEQLSF